MYGTMMYSDWYEITVLVKSKWLRDIFIVCKYRDSRPNTHEASLGMIIEYIQNNYNNAHCYAPRIFDEIRIYWEDAQRLMIYWKLLLFKNFFISTFL